MMASLDGVGALGFGVNTDDQASEAVITQSALTSIVQLTAGQKDWQSFKRRLNGVPAGIRCVAISA